ACIVGELGKPFNSTGIDDDRMPIGELFRFVRKPAYIVVAGVKNFDVVLFQKSLKGFGFRRDFMIVWFYFCAHAGINVETVTSHSHASQRLENMVAYESRMPACFREAKGDTIFLKK